MHGVNTAQAGPGDKALVYGAGAIGLCVVAALQASGVTDIVITDIVASRLRIAEELGAVGFNGREGSVIDFCKKHWGTATDSMGQETIAADVVLDCAGYKGVLSEFMANAKSGLRLNIVALSGEAESVVPYVFVAKDIKVLGSRGYRGHDIEQVIDALANDKAVITPIITAEFGLSEVVAAFQTATDKDNQIKVVINHQK